MTYVPLDAKSAGEPFGLTNYDKLVDNLAYLYNGRAAGRIHPNANQSIADSTITPLSLTVETFDNAGNMTSTPSRLTFAEAGIYLIGFNVSWSFNAAGYREAQIRANGVTTLEFKDSPPIAATTGPGQTLVGIRSMAAGDYIEAVVWQNSGGALNVLGASAYYTSLWAVRLT